MEQVDCQMLIDTLYCNIAGLKNVNRYIGNIVLSKIVISGFRCISV